MPQAFSQVRETGVFFFATAPSGVEQVGVSRNEREFLELHFMVWKIYQRVPTVVLTLTYFIIFKTIIFLNSFPIQRVARRNYIQFIYISRLKEKIMRFTVYEGPLSFL